MGERPIIFSAPMVRAVLAGRKSQTRLVLKPRDGNGVVWPIYQNGRLLGRQHPNPNLTSTPIQRGDTLWVRETWARAWELDEGGQPTSEERTYYRADGEPFYETEDGTLRGGILWKPSSHMPREFSRITLRVTGVRVERLKDISETDAKAEGVPVSSSFLTHRAEFFDLWNSLHGPGAWNANPWVAVIEFERLAPKAEGAP